jgi:hypothetical protein
VTMIEERALRTALHAAADSIPVPDGAVDQILQAAQRLDARPRAVRRFRPGAEVGRNAPDVAEERQPDDDRLDTSPQRRRPSRRVLVAAAVTAVLGISVAAATLGGSRSPNLAVSPTPQTAVARPPLHPAVAGAPGSATGGGVELSPLSPATTPSLPAGAVGEASKVEETGSVDLTVGKGQLEPVLTRLTNLATAEGGFVANTQTQLGSGTADPLSSGTITLQVPEASFAPVVAQAQTFGKVTALTTRGTDVTGQYVDLQARIAALEASREQYLTIMTKATSISDVLAVQEQLDNLQTQIEQLQGQLQVLDGETTYGTLVVSVSERSGHRAPVPHAQSGLARAWHGAVSGFAAAFDGLVRVAGPALFVLLCLAALAVLGRLAWRRVRRRTL